MISRTYYLNTIKPFIGKPVIKAITGLRRAGKSTFIKQIIDYLQNKGVKSNNIIYINKESLDFDFIIDYKTLNDYVSQKTKKLKGKIYIFIDEIQDIEAFEKTIASWSGEADRYDITITGSNSSMFSSELATKLTGRYIEFPIYPFSLKEYTELYSDVTSIQKLFENYITFGGLPGLKILEHLEENTAFMFLRSIHDTIVLKDIVKRKNIRNVELLRNVSNFFYSNISNPITALSINSYLKNQHIKSTVPSILNYIEGLTDAQLFYQCKRYDLKGKKHLEINSKYYASDIGLRHSQIGFSPNDFSLVLENIMFLELKRRFDRVYTGEINNLEIDFIAIKNSEPVYFQICKNLESESTLQREIKSLLAVKDNYPKYIITYDKYPKSDISGIKVINIIDYLLES
ncbi:MAG: ATP-binding protein [Candidatus Riflebacteria bacterium]|nr:ATP-binding protein [Candidatus Riflebacteria bacterium]